MKAKLLTKDNLEALIGLVFIILTAINAQWIVETAINLSRMV